MIPHHLELRPPGHPDGHPSLYCWSINSTGDVLVSGTSDDLADALDQASSALLDTMGDRE